jgi:hypothetical protein
MRDIIILWIQKMISKNEKYKIVKMIYKKKRIFIHENLKMLDNENRKLGFFF